MSVPVAITHAATQSDALSQLLTLLTTSLLQIAASVILGFGMWVVTRIVTWLEAKTKFINAQNESQITASLDDALRKSVIYGLQQSDALIREKGWDSPHVKSNAINEAATYFTSHFPGVLKNIKKNITLDPAQPDNQVIPMVRQALDRAFPAAVDAISASPATPSVKS